MQQLSPLPLSDTVHFVIFVLILRNVARNILRLIPMVVVLALSFAALTAGNGVLGTAGENLYSTYGAHVAGDFSVSPAGEESFTIFGSDMLLVGDFLVPPVLTRFDTLQELLRAQRDVRATAGVVTALARVEIARRRSDNVIFGVDIEAYRTLFPGLELVAGRWPEPGEPALLMQQVAGGDDVSGVVGQDALLSVARDNTFTLRTIPVVGVFRYPVADEMLARVVLTDPDTARSLNGYVHGAGLGGAGGGGDAGGTAGGDSLDDLFGDDGFWEDPEDEDTAGASLDLLSDLEQFFADTRDESTQARATIDGAWNFLLVAMHQRDRAPGVMNTLRRRGFTPEEGYLIRDWRGTVGGTAQIVWYLQLMMNGGLLFVAFGAVVIAANALMLSVLERTAEIGTMRALGASKQRVAVMIAGETVLVVAGAAVLGIILGGGALRYLNQLALVPENQYLAILFGGSAVRGTLTGSLVLHHLLLAVGLSAIAVVYPLKRALAIAPVKAMAAA